MNHHCPQCQTPTSAAVATTEVNFTVTAHKVPRKLFGTEHSDELKVRICPQCGLAFWYVEHPERFR